jgi:predicted transcriptional regulator
MLIMQKRGDEHYLKINLTLKLILFIILLIIFGMLFTIVDATKLTNEKYYNEETIWSGNVNLTNDVSIMETGTLIIEPGTNLVIQKDVYINIIGKIIAKGTQDKPITISGFSGLRYYIDKEGNNYSFPMPESIFLFHNEIGEQSIIDNATISTVGIYVRDCNVTISNCLIKDNSAINLNGNCSPLITNNIFRDNGICEPVEPWWFSNYYENFEPRWTHTLDCGEGTTAKICNNKFEHNGGYGINIFSASPIIENNFFSENRKGGIEIFNLIDPYSYPIIRNNTITDHGRPYELSKIRSDEDFRPPRNSANAISIGVADAIFYNNTIERNEIGIYIGDDRKGEIIFNNETLINNTIGVFSYSSTPEYHGCYFNNIKYDFWLGMGTHVKTFNTTFDEDKIYVEYTSKLETEDKIFSPGDFPTMVGGLGCTSIILVIFVFATEIGKYKFFTTFFPLYSRLKQKNILNQFVRGQIYGLIRGQPGIHYSKLKKVLKLGNGTLAYHLSILEKEGFISSKQDKFKKLFYPTELPSKFMEIDEKFPKGEEHVEGIKLSNLQRKIIEVIKSNPGITQIEIANKIIVPKQTINYNIKSLKREGIIEIVKEEKATRCYIKDMID